MDIRPQLPVTADEIRIRELTADDAEPYAEGTRDEAVRRFAHLPEPHYTPELVREQIDSVITPGLTEGTLAVLAIADARRDTFLGSVVLFNIDPRGAATADAPGEPGTRRPDTEPDTESAASGGPENPDAVATPPAPSAPDHDAHHGTDHETDHPHGSRSGEVGFWLLPSARGRKVAQTAVGCAAQLARRLGLSELRARTVSDNSASRGVLTGAGFVARGAPRQDTAPSGEEALVQEYVRRL